MRFLEFNFAAADNSTITASSVNPDFPASNLDKDSRSRVWRSAEANGHFEITTSNNKLDFRETSGGPEITATIPVGDYSATTLAAAIKAQLDAETLNARTYAVSISTVSGKWTITGSTFLELLWSSGTNTANSIGPSLGYAVTDQTGAVTYTSAATAIHTDENLVFDIKTQEDVDSIVLMWSALTGIQLTQDAEVRIQANSTDEWTSPAVDQVLTINEDFGIASHYFTTAQPYRFWRLKIVDPKNPDLYVEVGMLYIADSINLSQDPERGFSFSLTDNSNIVENEFGNQYVDILPIRNSMSFNYNALQLVDVELLEQLWRRNGTRKPIVVILDETDLCFDKDNFVIYGKFQKTLTHKQINFQLFEESLTITEIL